jgi:hypothetical protein
MWREEERERERKQCMIGMLTHRTDVEYVNIKLLCIPLPPTTFCCAIANFSDPFE